MRPRFAVPLALYLLLPITAHAGRVEDLRTLATADAAGMFPEANRIALVHSRYLTVEKSGRRKIRETHIYLIRKAGAPSEVTWLYASTDFRRLTRFEGMRIGADGSMKRFDKAMSTQSAGGTTATDQWVSGLAVTGLTPGDMAVFDLEYTEDFEGLLSDTFSLEGGIATARFEYRLRLPEGWTAEASLCGANGSTVSLAGAVDEGPTTVWAVDSIPAREENVPFRAHPRPRIVVSYDRADRSVAGFRSWKDISRWFTPLSESALTDSERVREISQGILAKWEVGGTATWADTVYALARAVRENLRYEQIYFGDGGYRPHRVVDVWDKRWGDCKDMSHVLIGLARSVGLRAYPVLVAAGRLSTTSVPTPFEFNHCIAAISRPERAGQYWFIDATAGLMPVDRLPESDQGSYALLVGTDKDTALVRLPMTGPDDNVSAIRATFSLRPDFVISGKVEERHRGDTAFDRRFVLTYLTPAERSRWLVRQREDVMTRAQCDSIRISGLEADSATLEIDYLFACSGAATQVADKLIIQVDPLTARSEPIFSAKMRDEPVDFGSPRQVITEIVLVPPPWWTVTDLPADISFENRIGSYTRHAEMAGHGVRWVRSYRIVDSYMEPALYGDVQALDKAVYAGDHARVVLRRE